jgi:arsenate reductase
LGGKNIHRNIAINNVMSTENRNPILPALSEKADRFIQEFHQIPPDRKVILNELAQFIHSQKRAGKAVYLNFICTHNSRRSHISQLWAQTAARYYGIENVSCFSGGTEATAFNPRAVKAMQEAGFNITITKAGENPVYGVRYAEGIDPIITFSKKYDDDFNPKKDFAAIMTCSHADENCPLVVGASARIALTYNDPKEFDGTPQETEKYAERVHEIGREIFYAFSKVSA